MKTWTKLKRNLERERKFDGCPLHFPGCRLFLNSEKRLSQFRKKANWKVDRKLVDFYIWPILLISLVEWLAASNSCAYGSKDKLHNWSLSTRPSSSSGREEKPGFNCEGDRLKYVCDNGCVVFLSEQAKLRLRPLWSGAFNLSVRGFSLWMCVYVCVV